MAVFKIYSVPATRDYTDGIPFISMKIAVGRDNSTSPTRGFEATRLDQIKAEYEAQKKMITEPSVILVEKLSGRAPAGFNDWNASQFYAEPDESANAS